MAGAATQVYTREFDAALARVPPAAAALLQGKITDMGVVSNPFRTTE